MKKLFTLTLLIGVIGLVAGCQTTEEADYNQTAETTRNAETTTDAGDAATTAKVKSALIADTEVGALGIDVDTAGGTVYLRGQVETMAQRAKAEEIARDSVGMDYQVVNQLEVQVEERGGM